MHFNSIEFIVFFPIVGLIYYLLPHRYRWGILLISSYVFYMYAEPRYLILILLTTLASYLAGLKMGEMPDGKKRKALLYITILLPLILLFIYKYLSFAASITNNVLDILHLSCHLPRLSFLLPVGISFYTFQIVSYCVDIYLRRIKPEPHLGYYALYISFFPKLIAGPIERPGKALPQLRQVRPFLPENLSAGLLKMGWGFYKKMVVADRLAPIVNSVFDQPDLSSPLSLLLGAFLFGYQIYCDFSGYTDIALGAARVLGIKLSENFNHPYSSQSIAEFWQRWHITLTQWFRDYIYLPLTRKRLSRGGNKYVKHLLDYNIILVFLISGVWHGANWTYIIWGGLHGLYLFFGNWIYAVKYKSPFPGVLDRIPTINKMIRLVITFTLVSLAWIFFRAETISQAFNILARIFSMDIFVNPSLHSIIYHQPNPVLALIDILIVLVAITALEITQYIQRSGLDWVKFQQSPLWVRFTIYISLALVVINLSVISETPFIYFNF